MLKAFVPRYFPLVLLMMLVVPAPAQQEEPKVKPSAKDSEEVDKILIPPTQGKETHELDHDSLIHQIEKSQSHIRTEIPGAPMSADARLTFGRMIPAPLVVRWQRNNGFYVWKVDVRDTTFYKGRVEGTSLHMEELSGADFIHVGDVPQGPQWKAFLRKVPSAIHVEGSVNESTNQLVNATGLASVPWNPKETVIFNALPYENTLPRRQLELLRMGVSSRGAAWQDLNRKIDEVQGGVFGGTVATSYSQKSATRENLLHELMTGTSNLLLIYLHFDGSDLYLPGLGGGKIGVDEIEAIQRGPDTAHRVIVLASCNGALDSAENKSLAAILLRNGIAHTVLATDELYSAENIPTLVKELLSGKSIRSSAVGLQQYVELRSIPLPWDRRAGTAGE